MTLRVIDVHRKEGDILRCWVKDNQWGGTIIWTKVIPAVALVKHSEAAVAR